MSPLDSRDLRAFLKSVSLLSFMRLTLASAPCETGWRLEKTDICRSRVLILINQRLSSPLKTTLSHFFCFPQELTRIALAVNKFQLYFFSLQILTAQLCEQQSGLQGRVQLLEHCMPNIQANCFGFICMPLQNPKGVRRLDNLSICLDCGGMPAV